MSPFDLRLISSNIGNASDMKKFPSFVVHVDQDVLITGIRQIGTPLPFVLVRVVDHARGSETPACQGKYNNKIGLNLCYKLIFVIGMLSSLEVYKVHQRM